MRRFNYRYSLAKGLRLKPTRAWFAARNFNRIVAAIMAIVFVATMSLQSPLNKSRKADSYSAVPGQNYMICNDQSQLTSPYTYHALASGDQRYTVSQYMALPGYGTPTGLPSLPQYIIDEGPSAEAADIFAPGATTNIPQYNYPNTPLVYFFEGGAYGDLGLAAVTGDLFYGGSAVGFPEPTFNDGGGADGINAQNGSFDFSGGGSVLASAASSGASSVTTTNVIPGFIAYVSFDDGTTYRIDSTTNGGKTLNLDSPLTNGEAQGAEAFADTQQPVSSVVSSASQGGTSLTLSASTVPFMQYGDIVVGDDTYQLTGATETTTGNSLGGYTVTVAGLDKNVSAGTPIYYNGLAGDVTVSYLDIANDQHNTTGTIYTGSGWTVTHNNIHDGNSNGPGSGVAFYGGNEGTVEYNCFSKMGDYGMNIFGTNNQFDYNEVYESNYQQDPGCGCSGGGKWWGTLNADVLDNAFVNISPGDGVAIWLDNGNSGTNITGNFFDHNVGSSVHSETGFDLNVTNNLFLDGGWGSGSGGCGNNCDGAVNINSSGGFNVPGSRYENQVNITNNQFINDWMGINIWQAGGRTCENSGEGWPDDAGYCSGGYPNTASTTANSSSVNYDFSHQGDTNHGFYTNLAQDATTGNTTILTTSPVAIHDQIGFSDPVKTTTTDTTNVTSFSGSGTIHATTTGFSASGGLLRVGTSDAWSDGQGSFTGAILSYTGISALSANCNNNAPCFTGVNFVRGSGTLGGAIESVQPYKVTGETCYSNDCKVTISPGLSANESEGTQISNAGTCQLFATAAALPSDAPAPDGVSYWDGCQWEARGVSVTGNTFSMQPSEIAASAPLTGGGTTTTCDNTHTDYCGTNFMADQFNSGEAPFITEMGANAMMSSSTFTGCPGWDPGCSTNPLANLNAGSNPPGAPANNGEAPYNNVWSGNTYKGPWSWNTYIYGNCFGGGVFMPSDSSTGHSLDGNSCTDSFAAWQNDWQQDSGSSYNPMLVTMYGLSANQNVHGSAQSVTAYEDTDSPNTINSTLAVNGTNVATKNSGPYNFALNTLSYHDGQYTLKVTGTDSASNTSNDSVPVYIDNGDLNNNNSVDLSDLAIMAAHWGQTDSNYSDGNITGQSTINLSDLSVLSANWGYHH